MLALNKCKYMFHLGWKFLVRQHMVIQGCVVTISYSETKHKFCNGRKESQNVKTLKMLSAPFQLNPID